MICLIWIYPFVWMISTSLKSNNEMFSNPGLIPQSWATENYVRAWTEANMGSYFFNTLIVTVGSSIKSAEAGLALLHSSAGNTKNSAVMLRRAADSTARGM